MTVDDDNSIYVGGLPYDATEESVRRAFDLYGGVVAVKIINDRHIGGKCYGFVTFTNPRSAVDAINDMNGRTIGGRVVRVNEVRTRGGRSSHMHERFREDEREMDWNRDRARGQFQDRDQDRGYSRDRSMDRSLDHDRDNGGDDRRRDRDAGQVRDQERNRTQGRDWQRGPDAAWNQDKGVERIKDHEKTNVQHKEDRSNDRFGADFAERRTRELSTSSAEFHKQVGRDFTVAMKNEELEAAIQRRDELQREIGETDERLEAKQLLVADLQEKSQKLEDSLANGNKLFSYCDMQLTRLQKCFIQVKDCTERLKSYELELQSLVDMAMMEIGDGETARLGG